MVRTKTLQQLFQRYRKPGDLVFAVIFLVIALLLLTQIPDQTKWVPRKSLFVQPRFWPAVAIIGMVVFGALHLTGSLLSPRIYGRLKEMWLWTRSLEYVAWFLAYVYLVPFTGYLPTTLVFALLLTLRVGYRDKRMLLASLAASVSIVLLFRTILEVKIPAGLVYEYLPDGIRAFALANL